MKIDCQYFSCPNTPIIAFKNKEEAEKYINGKNDYYNKLTETCNKLKDEPCFIINEIELV